MYGILQSTLYWECAVLDETCVQTYDERLNFRPHNHANVPRAWKVEGLVLKCWALPLTSIIMCDGEDVG